MNNNPFDGLLPDFTLFGAEFTELWQKLLAGLWGISLVVAAVCLIVAFSKLSAAGANPDARKDAMAGIIWSGSAVGLLLMVPVIWAAIVAIFGA